jgi:hypothetical protein
VKIRVSFKSAAEKRRLCDIWIVQFSETIIVPVLKSVAREQLVETVID